MHEHTEYTEGCFTCKLKTLRWGRVPGGARQGNFYYEDALRQQLGDLEANAEYTREVTEGYGHLRWSNGDCYYQDRTTGDYVKMDSSDFNKVMYGDKRGFKEDRSISVAPGSISGRSGATVGDEPKHDHEVEE